jgi:hypothetical protein
MKTIPLTQGKVALVDDADFEFLSQFKWHLKRPSKKARVLYAVAHQPNTTRNSTKLRMHRLLLPGAKEVDHINGDGLDNRRQNLRAATKPQNMSNMQKHRDNESGFKGVSRHQKRWCARIRNEFIGVFQSPLEAAKAYDAAALALFGEFARLNFPEQKNG